MNQDSALRKARKKADRELRARIKAGRTGLQPGERTLWEDQDVAWPGTVAEITPYLCRRYRFRRGFVIDEWGRLYDLINLVESYFIATALQGPFFMALPSRVKLKEDLERILAQHRAVVRSDERAALQEIIDSVSKDEKLARSGGWTPLAGGKLGGPARFGADSFRARGGRGGRTTDPHFNRLVFDLSRLFHDRYRERRAGTKAPAEARTEGRTDWTDVALFLIATRASWSSEKVPPLYQQALGSWSNPLCWPAKKLQVQAKRTLQSRSRRFEMSHRPTDFAIPGLSSPLRIALGRRRTVRETTRIVSAWRKWLAAIASDQAPRPTR